MLSNLFGTAGRIQIYLEAAGRNSMQRSLRFSEHYKLHGYNAGLSIPLTSMKQSPMAPFCPPRRQPTDHWSTVDIVHKSNYCRNLRHDFTAGKLTIELITKIVGYCVLVGNELDILSSKLTNHFH